MSMQRRLLTAAAVLSLSFGALSGTSLATAQTLPNQIWPNRPVKFIVSLGPGSGSDTTARLLAERLSPRWGQPVVVENRPGGDAVIAINALIGAHDDHTLLFTPTASFTAHPYQHDKLPYDARELLPVARVYNTAVGFVVSPTLDVKSVAGFVGLARSQPGKLNYATATGMTDMIYDGYFKSTNLAITRIAYRDVVSPMTDLAEGRIHAYVAGFIIVRSQLQAGRAKLLAITNSARAAMMPDVPTVTEAGFSALTFDGLAGLLGHRDMPVAARQRIASDIRTILSDHAIAERLYGMGVIANPGSGDEFAASLDEQRATLARIAKVLGIKPNS
jgi:tripartite-type tricarboxylate transporter receptor subunit TctC